MGLKVSSLKTHVYSSKSVLAGWLAGKDSQGLAVICTGFKRLSSLVVVICTGFTVVPLETHAIINKQAWSAPKTHVYNNKK